MSLKDAGSSSTVSFSILFSPRRLRSDAILLLTYALGNSLGNIMMKNAKKNKSADKNNQPSHHAPSQRGSELVIVGVREGEI